MSLTIDLSNKVALVTGVSQGIGLGVAESLAQAGCTIAGCARSDEDSQEARIFKERIRAYDRDCMYKSVDVTVSEQLSGLVDAVIARFGQLDCVISNAGVNVFRGTLDCSEEDWQYNIDLNLASHWRLGKLCHQHLAKSKNGSFLVMTSNHAYYTMHGCFPYNVTKTAIKGLVQSMAIEWGPEVRAIGLAPGFITTPGNDRWFRQFDNPTAKEQETIAKHPVGRLGTVEDVGAFCSFLVSDYATFMSGTTYLIDGGRSAIMQD
jgi:NAD(P)-dependent dehydrogenase (short-subunit alcohol dehydrogenase family)